MVNNIFTPSASDPMVWHPPYETDSRTNRGGSKETGTLHSAKSDGIYEQKVDIDFRLGLRKQTLNAGSEIVGFVP
ncbi:MAG: hypothetical protein OSA23_05255 [Rhodospirillales bacterium]|nr:hypothetical protein [Rhodospirillales bacterium]